jgi:hypothetical protein
MSATIGGSIEQASIRGRLFAATADADVTRKLGGFENEVQSNGNGTIRIIKIRVPWVLSDVVLEVNDIRGDQEFLQEVADDLDPVDITITLASGLVYQAEGTITGEVNYSTNAGTATVTLSGGGKMTRQ